MTITKSEKQTKDLAEKLAQKNKNGGIICLIGDLGSGKTIFAKGLAEYFNLDSFSIKSPTYTFIRKYKINKDQNLFHIDLYRLDEIDELLLNEIQEIMEDKSNIIIIEWADKMKDFLPERSIKINFKYIDQNQRRITFS